MTFGMVFRPVFRLDGAALEVFRAASLISAEELLTSLFCGEFQGKCDELGLRVFYRLFS